ncbi:VOC family protein [Leucobacter ruminantium]|uniref:VOC family protein n=1 Tax=Leucobacter ruminantium TaxID=1289170 RepID=A0A939LYC7_9MICO|nr:VOC family protein [Leucobacter ruminantium]MBO1803730.1 VOC family protein [Leucobacter ruminantium]
MIRLGMITIDTADARGLAAWWAERLGGEIVHDAEGWFCMVRAPQLPVALGFQRVDEPTPGKNRLHLDLDRGTEAARESVVADWVAAGATHLGQRGEADFRWDTFADPDGNEFCIGDPH